MASSSFMELKTSKPPSFHSPLSEVKTVDTLIQPWTEDASSLINLIVFARLERPHLIVSGAKFLLLMCHDKGANLSVAI
jgi:hypothetical protein